MTEIGPLVLELEKIERDGTADFFAAAPESVRHALAPQARRIGETLAIVCPGAPNVFFNRLLGLGVFEPARGEQADEAIAAFQAAGVGDWGIQFAEGARDFETVAASRGLTPRAITWAKFAREPAPAGEAVTNLSIREVGPADAAAFGTVVATCFHMPEAVGPWAAALPGRAKWRCFGAFHDDQLVATGIVYIDGGTAWLGFGATLEAYRGNGAQPALLAARIEAARAAGCTILSTETGIPREGEAAPSFKNILRAGFVIAYSRPNLHLQR